MLSVSENLRSSIPKHQKTLGRQPPVARLVSGCLLFGFFMKIMAIALNNQNMSITKYYAVQYKIYSIFSYFYLVINMDALMWQLFFIETAKSIVVLVKKPCSICITAMQQTQNKHLFNWAFAFLNKNAENFFCFIVRAFCACCANGSQPLTDFFCKLI